VVRLDHLGNRRQVRGTGFVVGEETTDFGPRLVIATCAHVVVDKAGKMLPSLRAVFRLSGEDRPVEQKPGHLGDPNGDDIAILHVLGKLPAGAQPAPMGPSLGTEDHTCLMLGYPDAGHIDGVGRRGTVTYRVKTKDGHPLIQLSADAIVGGLSGSPVADLSTRRVIGMISEILLPDKIAALAYPGFATPSEELQKACELIRLGERCPYRGLLPFREGNADLFSGRDEVSEGLVERLRTEPRFLAVIGSSGSGKSSVVQAGLLPRLQRGDVPGLDQARVLRFRPAESLRAAVLREWGLPSDPAEDVAALLGRALDQESGRWCVLYCDQFEEAFTTSQEAGQAAFLDLLAGLVRGKRPVCLILACRSDFYDPLVRSPLGTYLPAAQVNLRPMTQKELLQVISEPAKRVGLGLDPGLADAIVTDLAAVRHPLPLLEFTLEHLWTSKTAGTLSLETYKRIGRVTGALGQWAAKTLREFDEADRPLARRVFTRLIQYGEDEAPDTPRRLPLSRLGVEDERGLRRVVNALADARLLVTGQAASSGEVEVEIVHAALLHAWGELSQWVKDHRKFLIWRQRFQPSVAAWEKAGRSKDTLLREAFLAEAEYWRREYAEELTEAERQYVEQSAAAREARKARWEREAVRLRDTVRMAAVKHHADDPTRRAALLAEFESPATARGWMECAADAVRTAPWETAVPTEDKGTYSFLAFSGDGKVLISVKRDFNFEPALWLIGQRGRPRIKSVEAVADGPNTKVSRAWLFPEPASGRFLLLSADGVLETHRVVEGYSSWGAHLMERDTEDVSRPARLQRIGTVVEETLRGLGEPYDPETNQITEADYSYQSRRLVTWHKDHSLRLWDLSTGEKSARVIRHAGGEPGRLLVSPDGSQLVVTLGRRVDWIPLDAVHGEYMRTFGNHTVNAVAFHPNSVCVVTACQDGTARVWPITSGAPYDLKVGSENDPLTAVAFTPWGDKIVTGSAGGRVVLWPYDGEEGRPRYSDAMWDQEAIFSATTTRVVRFSARSDSPYLFRGHDSAVREVLFSSDGHVMLTTSDSGPAALWPLRPVGRPVFLGGQVGQVTAAAISADGKQVATAELGGAPRVWRADWRANPSELLRPAGRGSGTGRVSRVVVESTPKGEAYWVLLDHRTLQRFGPGHLECRQRLSFDYRVRRSASSKEDPELRWMYWQEEGEEPRFFPLRDGGNPFPLVGMRDPLHDLALSPDAATVIGVTRSGRAFQWDAVDPAEPKPFGEATAGLTAVAFDPTGRRVAAGYKDGHVRVWNQDGSGSPVILGPARGEVDRIEFAPDGEWLLAKAGGYLFAEASGRHTSMFAARDARLVRGGAAVLAVKTRDQERYLCRAFTVDRAGARTEHRGDVRCDGAVLISPAGDWVLNAPTEDDPRVWSMTAGLEPIVLRGAGGRVGTYRHTALAASQDGKRIVTGHANGVLLVWDVDLDPRSLQGRLRQATSYRLTVAERMDLLGEGPAAARRNAMASRGEA
jgi:WD40 repeat protein